MYLSDYHIHTDFSPDGHATVFEMVHAAYKLGFSEIVFTDHYEAVKNKDLERELNIEEEILSIKSVQKKFGDKIKIKFGIELGQPHFNPSACKKILDNYPFDFVIGSVHNILNDNDLYHYNYNEVDHIEIFEQYLKELLDMAENSDFDVMGHLTYPLRYMWAQAKKTIDIKKYESVWKEILSILIERGKGIEVNTSGLRQPISQFLPPLYLVKLYRSLGGKIITVGSDAHWAKDVTLGIDKALLMIKEAGFSEITLFDKRKPSFIKID